MNRTSSFALWGGTILLLTVVVGVARADGIRVFAPNTPAVAADVNHNFGVVAPTGSIMVYAGTGSTPPDGWLFCDATSLAGFPALAAVLGTSTTPDLRGRVPLHQGNGFILAETGGAEEITLTVNQIAAHSHPALCSTNIASDANPQGRVLAQTSTYDGYQTTAPNTAMAPQSITATGGSQPHTNFQPYLCINFIISLFGIFPSPT